MKITIFIFAAFIALNGSGGFWHIIATLICCILIVDFIYRFFKFRQNLDKPINYREDMKDGYENVPIKLKNKRGSTPSKTSKPVKKSLNTTVQNDDFVFDENFPNQLTPEERAYFEEHLNPKNNKNKKS